MRYFVENFYFCDRFNGNGKRDVVFWIQPTRFWGSGVFIDVGNKCNKKGEIVLLMHCSRAARVQICISVLRYWQRIICWNELPLLPSAINTFELNTKWQHFQFHFCFSCYKKPYSTKICLKNMYLLYFKLQQPVHSVLHIIHFIKMFII